MEPDDRLMGEEEVKTRKEAARIREDYAYMDNLPLEGWIWEFIRRSSKYRQQFELAERFINNLIGKKGKGAKGHARDVWDEKRIKDVMDLNNILSEFPERMSHFIFENKKEPLNKDYFLVIHYPFEGLSFIPRPDTPYPAFGSDLDNYLQGMKPVIWRDYEFFKTKIMDLASEIDSIDTSNIEDLKSWFIEAAHSVLWELTPYYPDETIYVAFTKRAGKEDIKNEIGSIFDKFGEDTKKKPRSNDKWKYYLIAHDLEKQGSDYSKIANILSKAYPDEKSLFDADNIERYWKRARDLIDWDEYTKYLPGALQKK